MHGLGLFGSVVVFAAAGTGCATDETKRQASEHDAGVSPCGSAEGTSTGSTNPDAGVSPGDGGATVVLSVPSGGGIGASASVDIAASSLQAPFAPRLTGGTGTVLVDYVETAATVIGQSVFAGYDVYEVLAVSTDRLTVLWYYCKAGVLRDVFAEDTRGTVTDVTPIMGSCSQHAAASPSATVDFPATSFDAPRDFSALRIDGPSIAYSGSAGGHAVISETDYSIYPFASVDCTAGGWREVHVVLWNASQPTLGVGIIYLFPPSAARLIQFSFGFLLPTGDALPDAVFPDATWTLAGRSVEHTHAAAPVALDGS
jgi:hypothetical protein